jgi:hypothetical protein
VAFSVGFDTQPENEGEQNENQDSFFLFCEDRPSHRQTSAELPLARRLVGGMIDSVP